MAAASLKSTEARRAAIDLRTAEAARAQAEARLSARVKALEAAQAQEDKEAADAIAKFKAEMKNPSTPARAAAVSELARVQHQKTLNALLPFLHQDTGEVRKSAAAALGAFIDYKKIALPSLLGAIAPNQKEPMVLESIFLSVGKLGDETTLPTVVKKDGQREAFDRQKILRSLRIACNKRPVTPEQLEEEAEQLEREVGESGEKEMSSLVIGERVMARLKKLDEVAYVRFASVYRSFRDIDEFMNEMGKLVRSKAD